MQVDPINPMLKAPGTHLLTLKYDEMLSSFAFKFNLRRYNQVPEMHRVPLTEIVLQIKKLGVGQSAEEFLAGALEPPAPLAVAGGVIDNKHSTNV